MTRRSWPTCATGSGGMPPSSSTTSAGGLMARPPAEIDRVAAPFAEASPMTAARAIVTADTPAWAEVAGRVMTGYATSVIACDAEASIERALSPDETPDGRPGVGVLLFAFSRDA